MAKLGCGAIGLVVFGAIGAIGCGPETSTSGTDPVCPEDPADGAVPEACGIWVSAAMGDDKNEGTQAAPVATLTHAIELADKGPSRVYACGETWSERLTIPGGVSLQGGFDCQDGWKYVGEDKQAALVSPYARAIDWAGLSVDEMFLTDFYVAAADAEPYGGTHSSSSIAILLHDQMTLHVRRCHVVSGDGEDGADGEDGESLGVPAAGVQGNPGADACSGLTSKGGAATETPCPASFYPSRGGAGGDSTVASATDGEWGDPTPDPPGGQPGLGEESSPKCTAGADGGDGADGAWGYGQGREPADLRRGHLMPSGYRGEAGHPGESGAAGQGGGGGGATFGNAAVCGASMSGGAAGGSGGTGGCGGWQGEGGYPGGASIGIAIFAGRLVTDDVTFTTGRGGNGGNGGKPQVGAPGAPGGTGGKGAGSIAPGCAGGAGGHGGKSGWGGGGPGGDVAAVGVQDSGLALAELGAGNQYELGPAGKGGLGDPDHAATSNGSDGSSLVNPGFPP